MSQTPIRKTLSTVDLPLLVRPHDIPKVLGGISTRGFYNLLNSDPECPRFARIGKRSTVLFMDELLAYCEVLRRRRDEELGRGIEIKPPGADADETDDA
jgi:hypothetical protein